MEKIKNLEKLQKENWGIIENLRALKDSIKNAQRKEVMLHYKKKDKLAFKQWEEMHNAEMLFEKELMKIKI